MMKTLAAAGAAATLLVGASSAGAVALPAPVQVGGHADHSAHDQAAGEDHSQHGQADDQSRHGADDGHGTAGAANGHDHGSPEQAPDHGAHDGSGSREDGAHDDGSHGSEEGAHDGGSGHDTSEPDSVSEATRASVLGGFGAVNAAVIGGAFLLRRRDRRTGQPTRRDRKARR